MRVVTLTFRRQMGPSRVAAVAVKARKNAKSRPPPSQVEADAAVKDAGEKSESTGVGGVGVVVEDVDDVTHATNAKHTVEATARESANGNPVVPRRNLIDLACLPEPPPLKERSLF